MKKIIFNSKGASLIQSLIFAGLLSGLAMVGTQIINQKSPTTKDLKALNEINYYHQVVESVMMDEFKCSLNIYGGVSGLTDPDAGGNANRIVTAVFDESNTDFAFNNIVNNAFIDQNVVINTGNNTNSYFGLESISLNHPGSFNAASDTMQESSLDFVYKIAGSNKSVIKNMPIFMNPVQDRCYADPDGLINTIQEDFCTSMGNILSWDAGRRECRLNIDCTGRLFAGLTDDDGSGNVAAVCLDPAEILGESLSEPYSPISTTTTTCNFSEDFVRFEIVPSGSRYRLRCETITCPGDFNGDNFVNSLDATLFSANFLGTDLNYDMTGDGQVDSSDLSVFISYYFSTCT